MTRKKIKLKDLNCHLRDKKNVLKLIVFYLFGEQIFSQCLNLKYSPQLIEKIRYQFFFCREKFLEWNVITSRQQRPSKVNSSIQCLRSAERKIKVFFQENKTLNKNLIHMSDVLLHSMTFSLSASFIKLVRLCITVDII
jgi:hypothetical protein